MSEDLVWLICKKNSCFYRKRKGQDFSMEPQNLRKLNAHKYSALAHKKAIGMHLEGKDIVVDQKAAVAPRNPKKTYQSYPLKYNYTRMAKGLKVEVEGVKPSLEDAALHKLYALKKTQTRKNVPVKIRAPRGAKKN